MSTEPLNVREQSHVALEQHSNGKTEDNDSNLKSSANEKTLGLAAIESKKVPNSETSELLPGNNKEFNHEKDPPGSLNTSKTKVVKTIVKKEHVPGNLSPLSKKLRRDSIRTQLKRACTLALTEQPKTSPTIKTRGRRHSTGTSKDSTKKPVIKKNLRKTLTNNTMKRKREDSTDQPKTEGLKTVDDIENVKNSKLRRKSNESSLSEPIKSDVSHTNDKELDSPIKTLVDVNKRDSIVSNSPTRARRSTRLSPETIPKAVVCTKRRGRPAKTSSLDSNTQESPNKIQIEQKESGTNISDDQKLYEDLTKIKSEKNDECFTEDNKPLENEIANEQKQFIKVEESSFEISEIKVQQFYSKPEFFENNLESIISDESPSLKETSKSDSEEISSTYPTPTDVEININVSAQPNIEETAMESELADTIKNTLEMDLKPADKEETLDTKLSNESKKDEAIESPIKVGKDSLIENLSPIDEKLRSEDNSLVENSEVTSIADNDSINLDIPDVSLEIQREKENHLKHLGLLTLQAAKDEKRKKDEKKSEYLEEIYDSSSNSKFENEYTGTLKTVIKLNKPVPISSTFDCESNKKKQHGNNITHARQSLKMTFQKGKVRNTNVDKKNQISEEDYYTIQNEGEICFGPHNRKGRSNIDEKCTESVEKGDEKKEILIPEKASSFAIHPGRLCQDQCYYCGGKFGLYDTPCHVAQIKSTDRQEKILKNEEKLTVDNCLCDACFRHVDRRANTPAYKKRLNDYLNGSTSSTSASPKTNAISENSMKKTIGCFIPDCNEKAVHSLQKKIVKKRLKKFLPPDIIISGTYVQICQTHYDIVMQHIICNLCKRRLNKSHMFPILHNLDHIYERLKIQEINIDNRKQLLVCKQCKYYINLIGQEDYEYATDKSEFCINYRKRLLKIYNKPTNQSMSKVLPSIGYNMDMDTSSEETNRNDCHQSEIKTGDVSDSYVVPSDSDSDSSTSNRDSKGDISTVLRSNPNLSMRQLFPGEEELGIQFKAPFNTYSEKTPEGWTRVQSFLQYDEPTRKLWEELQKPYGNSSSFLRHLIILEKFYRNGDLILSPKASTNSYTYNTCVQNRLNSYDNFSPNKIIAQFDDSVNKIQRQLSNNSVTMTTKPKDDNQKSLQSVRCSISNNKKNKLNKGMNSVIDKSLSSTKTCTATDLPPELISISKTADSHNRTPQKTKMISLKTPSQIANVIKLPETLTPQERLSSKNWRPTLIPLTSTTHLNQQGPLYLTADGRRLPALVQVQSSGRPFLISIHDYNRMCILRREKLLRDQMLKANNKNALNGILNTQMSQSNKILEKNSGNYRLPSATATSSIISRPSTSVESSGIVPTTFKKVSNILPIAGGGHNNNIKTNLLLKDRELLSKIPKNLTVIPQIKSQTFSNASLLSVFPQNNNPLTPSLSSSNIKSPNYVQDKKNTEK
ncbi:hypothetical protein ACFFRR_001186 [Megaselia abdita]